MCVCSRACVCVYGSVAVLRKRHGENFVTGCQTTFVHTGVSFISHRSRTHYREDDAQQCNNCTCDLAVGVYLDSNASIRDACVAATFCTKLCKHRRHWVPNVHNYTLVKLRENLCRCQKSVRIIPSIERPTV